MFTSIKTSQVNKEIVSRLTNQLNLGAENMIARLALAYSLSKDRRMDLKNIADSKGKEYSTKVLFGSQLDYYVAMICVHYTIYSHDNDLAKYVKMHIDDGLQLINDEVEKQRNITGYEFLINTVEKGLKHLV